MDKVNRDKIREIYMKQEVVFPMIGAVIEGNTEGEIYCNNNENPSHIFVVNKFGFCQEIDEQRDDLFFENVIKRYIEKKDRRKLRLYNPQEELFRYVKDLEYAQISKRMHFVMDKRYVMGTLNKSTNLKDLTISAMTEKDFEECFNLDLATRYYSGKEDFCNNAIPIIARVEEEIVGIIYSVANDNMQCEVDIFIDEQYRNKGIALQLVSKFIKEAEQRKWIVNWDCYMNNAPSMNVAKKCGFIEVKEYFYFNISNAITRSEL